ncbi:Calx-beta domain-containing protein [Hymenobacter endophyticus]|uniref:Calx-beta domain-containing protein n=1 Tax=Hymenobacter endophyticus TaxID=3076335 RepID=A0ABU3TK28_9BACT|nr:Calx-beta domain-containing protein [Hymenobacter endophyticus]MDU0371728.1 Calx-beta domain-containing protein [Hymenobacter endophyticus]
MKHSYTSWRQRMAVLAALGGLTATAQAQTVTPVAFTGATYNQNFDGLTATGTTYPDGWSGIRLAGTGTLNAVLTMAVQADNSNAGTVYNAGAITGTTTDRALGSISSNSTVPAFGAAFTNQSGAAISGLTLAGRAEQWRSGENALVESLAFEYSTDATSLSTGTWTAVSALDIRELGTVAATPATLNGNDPANSAAITATFPITWAAGSTIWIRWKDTNDAGADALLALDDFTLSAATITAPTAPTVSFGSATATVAESAGTVQIPVTLSAASTQAVSVEVAVGTAPGTATSPADYTFTTQTLTFPAGTTTQNATITIVDDAVFEQSETIALTLRNVLPAGAATVGIGTYTITITDNDTAPAPTVTAISALKPVNADGTPTQTGSFTVTGVIYGPNYRTAGYQGTIMDRTGGLGLFSSSNLSFAPVQGDSVQVTGTLGTFRGLSQLTVTSITKLGTSKLMRARVVTGPLTEAEESQLIVLPNVTATTPSEWTTTATAAYTVKVQTAAGISYDVRINPASTLFNQPVPTGSFSITGIGSQFASAAAPYAGGYQLVPRTKEDVGSVLTGTRNALNAGNVRVFPNPATDNLTIQVAGRAAKATVTVTDLTGRAVLKGTSALDGSFSLHSLRAGSYILLVQNGSTLTSHKIVKQ